MPGRIFVMGHSHACALEAAHKRRVPGAQVPEMRFALLNDPQFEPPMAEGGLCPALLGELRAAAAEVHVSVLGGNDHSIIGMLNHPQRFDFVLPEAPELPVDEMCEILPAGLLRGELARRVAPHLAVLAAYRAAVPGRLVHIESPPPVPSAAHIRTYPGIFKDMIVAYGVSPALLRYKLWRLHSALYREACARLGVAFLGVPAEMQDAQGMMVEAGWNPDPTHGNPVYGAHVLEKLAASLGEPAR
ncbi:hypothetical protein [Acidocella sp.]|uniref:hypothetical protein n=1 Tax=Acidocella sp. TaxID=50710 RepID=UPI0026236279|nr:hypothetical protein [Acidocella sp.]MDD2796337.1 hypothetical protein [Acidocella sp.]